MPKSDPLDIMLAHNEWATRNVLEACAKLTPEQFHKTFEIGPGTLHNATLHIVGAMRTWTQTLAGQQPQRASIRMANSGRPRRFCRCLKQSQRNWLPRPIGFPTAKPRLALGMERPSN